MIQSLLLLLAFQFLGEVLSRGLALPLPGPVLGMAALTCYLLARPAARTSALQTTTRTLLSIMGLLFVPAGVGVVGSLPLLRAQWFPVTAGLAGSSLLSLLATALVMHWLLPRIAAAKDEAR